MESAADWNSTWKEVKEKFQTGNEFWWGDNLDVRFFLYQKLKKIHGKRILDLASGPGVLTSALPEDNEILSIELNPKACEVWKKVNHGKKNRKIKRVDMFDEKTYVGMPAFDIVLLSHGIPGNDYHSDKTIDDILRLVKNKLNDWGAFILTTPNNLNSFQAKKGKTYGFFDIRKKLMGSEFEIMEMRSWNPSIYLTKICRVLPFAGIGLRGIEQYYRGTEGVSLYVEARLLKKG